MSAESSYRVSDKRDTWGFAIASFRVKPHFYTRGLKDCHFVAQVDYAMQRYDLIGFLVYKYVDVGWEPVLLIDNGTVRRVPRVSILIESFVETSNLCFLGVIILDFDLTFLVVHS